MLRQPHMISKGFFFSLAMLIVIEPVHQKATMIYHGSFLFTEDKDNKNR